MAHLDMGQCSWIGAAGLFNHFRDTLSTYWIVHDRRRAAQLCLMHSRFATQTAPRKPAWAGAGNLCHMWVWVDVLEGRGYLQPLDNDIGTHYDHRCWFFL